MKATLVALLLLQFGARPALTPAETLLEPLVLRAINEQPGGGVATGLIEGTDKSAGEILITCRDCDVATQAMQKLHQLITEKGMPPPARSIRRVTVIDTDSARRAKAAIFVAQSDPRPLQILRGLWSTAGIVDEVVEIFARHGSAAVDVRPFENLGQLQLDHLGVPTTTIVTSAAVSSQHAAFVAAASAYFLATLPNAGAEALLSHLTIGAHARLAEDGRRAVALMGNQQRASADVLVMFGQAIEREQRRMRSFEGFMPGPADPMLRSRIADMEKGITSVWNSIGLTGSPFVPANERLRGRAGEDRRIPARTTTATMPTIEPPAALSKLPDVGVVVYEISNFIDGKRSISDIRDAVAAQFGNLPLPATVDYFERLAKAGAVTLR